MFHNILDKFSISTLMIINSYDDGYFRFPCSDYFTKSYLYLLKAINSNKPYADDLKDKFRRMALDIYFVEGKYRYEEIKLIMQKHKKSTQAYLDSDSWAEIDELVTAQNTYSRKKYQNTFLIPDDDFDIEKITAETNLVDELLTFIMNEFPDKDLTDEFPVVKYVHEPFSNIKIQFDEFGKSSRIEFDYLGSKVVYRIKAEPEWGHGAYGHGPEYSYNLLDGGYIDRDTIKNREKESLVATVLRYFLVMGRKLSARSRGPEEQLKIDKQIIDGELRHHQIFTIHDEYKQLLD